MLEGVYEMLPRPDELAIGRLALQLDLDMAAVRVSTRGRARGGERV